MEQDRLAKQPCSFIFQFSRALCVYLQLGKHDTTFQILASEAIPWFPETISSEMSWLV